MRGVRQLKSQYSGVNIKDVMVAMKLCVELAVVRACKGSREADNEPWTSAWIEVVFAHKKVEEQWMPEHQRVTWNSGTKKHIHINVSPFLQKRKMATKRVPRARIRVSTLEVPTVFRGESVSGHPGPRGGIFI